MDSIYEKVFFQNVMSGERLCCDELKNEEQTKDFINNIKKNCEDFYNNPTEYLIDNAYQQAIENADEKFQLEVINFILEVTIFDWNKIFKESCIIDDLPLYNNNFKDSVKITSEEISKFLHNKFNHLFYKNSKQILIRYVITIFVNRNETIIRLNALKLLFKLIKYDCNNEFNDFKKTNNCAYDNCNDT